MTNCFMTNCFPVSRRFFNTAILSAIYAAVLSATIAFVFVVTCVVSPHTAHAQDTSKSSVPAATCDEIKQVLFVIDVSGSMDVHNRLGEVIPFAVRAVEERKSRNLLYKLISFGGSCDDANGAVRVDCDWTREVRSISFALRSLELRGATPFAPALDTAIEAIKKSAYPDQTQVILLNDGATTCGNISELLGRRLAEIPCVRFTTIGVELQEEKTGRTDQAVSDLKTLAQRTGGSYVPLQYVEELRGVTIGDTAAAVVPLPQATIDSIIAARRSSSQTPPAAQTAQSSEGSQNSQSPQNSNSQAQENPQPSSSQASQSPQTEPAAQSQASSSTAAQPASLASAEPRNNPRSNSRNNLRNSPSNERTTYPSNQTASNQATSAQSERYTSRATTQRSPRGSKPDPLEISYFNDQTANRINRAVEAQARESQARESRGEHFPANGVNMKYGADAVDGDVVQLWFEYGSASLMPTSQRDLERLTERLRAVSSVERSWLRVSVDGHAAWEGSAQQNLELSVRRASLIASHLRDKAGYNDRAITWTGWGTLRPVRHPVRYDEAYSSETTYNRRVEVRVLQRR